ncbi:MAG: tryptophan synthase subunit alpha [Deltaproteobacteria bacterium]|nr:tryptophan synthase subunit alpha [Deltaproteobacteria bacterium]
MALESYIREGLKKKDILLMTHIVLGYPSFDASMEIIRTMVKSGVDIMELQIPFSEPTADGPVIVQASQRSIEKGATVERCLELAGWAAKSFNIPFLIMSYYNIPFKYGVERFAGAMAGAGLKGAIIADIPPEEGMDYLAAMQKHNMEPIMLISPTTTSERMKFIASFAKGFIYCVARKGVTGKETDLTKELEDYLKRCRREAGLPLAVGFGIKDKADIDFLKGKAEIAVIGTRSIDIMEKKGIGPVGDFIRSLR